MRKTLPTLAAAVACALFSATLAAAPITVRVQGPAEPDVGAEDPAVSADGKTVAFTSSSTNLAPAGHGNLYLYDVRADAVQAVTTSADGQAAAPVLSADGRYLAFETTDNELGDGVGTGAGNDVLRYDRVTGVFLRASRATDPAQPANASSRYPAISGDGRYVAFTSQATNLVAPAPTGNTVQVYEMDMVTRAVTMLSRSAADGAQGNSDTLPLEAGAFSSDGSRFAFATDATNLATVFAGNVSDAIVRRIDRNTGAVTFENLNRAADGTVGNLSSSRPSLSPNGRHVVFLSNASNILPGGRSPSRLYVRDLDAGTLRGLPLPAGMETCNRGRIDNAGDAVIHCTPTAANGTAQQLFRVTAAGTVTLLTRSFAGGGFANGGSGAEFGVSADGRMVVTDSAASDLVQADGNGDTDVFMVAEAALFDELFRDGFE